ncbi:MAG: NifB/NifX family molybdenum-iron cluster-binding protein [Fidelibacterota bacterium]
MKIAFTSKGSTWKSIIDPRFGRTDYIVLYDEESEQMETIDNRSIQQEAHGAGPKTAQLLLENKPDVLITGNGPGGNAGRVLERGRMDIYIGAGDLTIEEAYEKYKKGELNKF